MSRARLVAVFSVTLSAACGIPQDDPLPGIGARCTVGEGLCSLDLVCVPDDPDSDSGVCAPVLDYGACPKPEHLPGRFGTVSDGDVLLDEAADASKLDGVRRVAGRLKVHTPGSEIDLGTLCTFRALQRVDDGLVLGNTDVETLDGLNSLTSVKNGIAIFGNGDLTSLAGLVNLVDVEPCSVSTRSVQIIIARNDALTKTTIDEFESALTARFGKEPQIIRCENGPNNDADPGCGVTDAAALAALQDGEAVCE